MAAGVDAVWEVVGGVDKGGIVVRRGQDLSSAAEAARLSTGAQVRGLELVSERLHYELVAGEGPPSGWVSIRVQGKDLLVRREISLGAAPLSGVGNRATSISRRVAVVTGANKGIGFYTAKQLLDRGLRVVVACRNEALGQRAAKALGCNFETLDLDNTQSINAFVEKLHNRYERVDILVNNAATIGEPSTPFHLRTEPTLRTNFYSLVALTDAMLPLLRASAAAGQGPRIVNLGSVRGNLGQLAPRLAAQFSSPTLDRPGLFKLVAKFVEDVKLGRHEQEGWGNSNYGFSKLAVMAFTKILAREEGSAMRVNAAEPGNCQTDMNDYGDVKPEIGAQTTVKCALLADDGPTGEIFKNERVWQW